MDKQSSKKRKKRKKKKITIKEFLLSEQFLKIVFIALTALVLILLYFVYRKNKIDKDKVKANMVIPLKEFDNKYSFQIELKSLVDKKYLFKVTNYRGNDVNNEDVYYTLTVNNDTESVISVTKDDNKKVIGSKIIAETDAIKLDKGEKIEDYYYVEIENENKITDDEMIQIIIESNETANFNEDDE